MNLNSKKIFLSFVRIATLPFLVIGFALAIFAIWLRAVSGDKEAQIKMLSLKDK